MGARARWGRTLPASLGFIEVSDEAELSAIEASLRAEPALMAIQGTATGLSDRVLPSES